MELNNVTIHEIGETQVLSDKFQKRDLIIKYAENEKYPEFIKFEMVQDKCDIADRFDVGDNVNVSFNLRGRPHTDKNGKTNYFNSLVIWKMNPANGENAPEYAQPANIGDESDSGLPF